MRARRVEFRLSMPGRASWNGKWSGEDKNYTVVRMLSDEQIAKLFDTSIDFADRRSWMHRWSDGWLAELFGRPTIETCVERQRDEGCSIARRSRHALTFASVLVRTKVARSPDDRDHAAR